MLDGYANQAIQSVLNSRQAYCKFLSANDSGATGGHQSGILVSKDAWSIMFPQTPADENILKRTVKIQWQNDLQTESSFTKRAVKPLPSGMGIQGTPCSPVNERVVLH